MPHWDVSVIAGTRTSSPRLLGGRVRPSLESTHRSAAPASGTTEWLRQVSLEKMGSPARSVGRI